MRKILVCQHVAFEILGTLNPLFRRAGFRIRYVNFGRYPDAQPSLDGYHGLVLLGGPMSVYDTAAHPHLDTEVRLVDDALRRGMPVLGICLGAQLIAKALGAPVAANREKEIGWHDVMPTAAARQDPVLGGFAARERLFHWHGDTFAMPRGAVHLASSALCDNQAFRYGSNVYGFQFHLEVDAPLIERWLRVPVHRRELEECHGAVAPERIRADTAQHLDNLTALSERTFGQFIDLFGPFERRCVLPSR
ncbi:MAG: glutamine amidotransferase-related protein [Candidatus Binatia bacterium]